jgi:hypothetical protein
VPHVRLSVRGPKMMGRSPFECFYTIRNQGAGMVLGLERRQENGDLHFVTFSCYQRCAYLGRPGSRDLFEDALAKAQRARIDLMLLVM